MQKSLLLFFGLGLSFIQAFAQYQVPLQAANAQKSEAFPALISRPGFGGPDRVNALFDVQFNIDLNANTSTNGGLAAAVFFDRKFWVAKWNSTLANNDSIFEIRSDGSLASKFRIQGVSGVRGMTFDGESIYAGQNSNTIAIIDPRTRTRTGVITAPGIVGDVRYITYSPSADGGLGGFYVGNFNTAFYLISRTGTVLEIIAPSTHGQSGVYGLAYDTLSNGGPFLWAFCQNDNGQNLVRLNGETGEPTNVSRNVLLDFGATTTGNPLAGGCFVAPAIQNDTTPIVGGLIQGTPNRLFGYELGVFALPSIEAEMVSLTPTDEYLMKPRIYNPVVNFTARVTNQGATNFDTIYVVTTLRDPDSLEINTNTRFATNLSYPDSSNINTGFTLTSPDPGRYIASSSLFLWNGNIDPTPVNNSKSSQYYVTDSVFSRSFPTWNGSLGIGSGGGFIGNRYQFPVRSLITSITARFNAPSEGDSVFFQVSNFAGSNPGTNVLRRTDAYIFTAEDSVNGVWLTLPLRGGPLSVNPITVMISAREHLRNMTMATNGDNWRANSTYARVGATGAWQTLESANFRRAALIWPNVQLTVDNKEKLDPSVGSVYPNPASGQVFVNATGFGTFIIRDLSGKLLVKSQVKDGQNVIPTSTLSSGLYLFELQVKGKKSIGKLGIE